MRANDSPTRLVEYLFRLGGSILYYGSASQAIKDIFMWLNEADPGNPPNVVMPTYESSSLYKTALASGYEPRFYEIYDDCLFDLAEIEKLIDNNTKAILVIHYFGKPANILPLRELATRTGKYLIEDCALALVGSVDGIPLGSIGDCSIFSARKMLMLPDGGILVMRTGAESFKPRYTSRASSVGSLLHVLLSRLKQMYLMAAGTGDPLHLTKLPERGHIDLSERQVLAVREISRISKFFLKRVRLPKHVERRRENYMTLLKMVQDISSVRPLSTKTCEQWTPYTLPLRVYGGKRDAVQAHLYEQGIACGCGWPEGPFDLKHGRSRELAGEILELPVHPLLTRRQIDSISRALRNFEASNVTGDKR